MQRIAMKREAAEKYTGPLCPKIQKKLDKIIEESSRCWSRHAGGRKFQVSCGPADQHTVDLEIQSCSCRKWDLTGIPCSHAVAVFFTTEEKPEEYVHSCYHKETQLQIYSHFIQPIRGSKQWSHVENMEPILPPMLRRPPGRPHKSRRKEMDETPTQQSKISKKGVHMTCRKCGQSGHNARTCKGQVGGNKRISKMHVSIFFLS